jgi:RNA polymerase sigma factor (sigma-70 family)
MFKMAIADDHPVLRQGMINLLKATGIFVCLFEAGNGQEMIDALSLLTELPDIIIVDISMPLKNGFEVLSWVKQNHPEIKVILLSLFAYQEVIGEALSIGADEYISKSQLPDEMVKTITDVAIQPRKRKRISGSSEKIISSYFSLTNREKEVLELSSSELSYKEIAKQLYISENTIEKHRASLFKKLKVKSRLELVIKGIRHGWVKWW